MTYEDLQPCRACGAPCDGDVCDERCERMLLDDEEDTSEDDEDDEEP